ncbi:hypothetical protein ADK35_24700 [Streptomyces viridochromogenes]|nr:hypothetical protein ADK35_24700 [Streptomyces viridochromogenes]KOG20085.1 hypothetical protein ADK36_17360 [Streptomyces viridochromogenes]
MHGQQLSRLEEKSLAALGKLEEVAHPARLATELDDVAALHSGRGDLDVGCQRAARCPAVHLSPSMGAEWWAAE